MHQKAQFVLQLGLLQLYHQPPEQLSQFDWRFQISIPDLERKQKLSNKSCGQKCKKANLLHVTKGHLHISQWKIHIIFVHYDTSTLI